MALRDLARGTELPFLPIGRTWYALFEPAGDLLTLSTGPGVQRWPITLDATERGLFQIGPPHQFQMPRGAAIAADQTGTILALALYDRAIIATPELTTRIEPLDDVRSVAISPDGAGLATGSG